MTISHRVAQPAELDRLFAMLDQEFVLNKGRKTSLATRYPSTYCAANAGNIFLTEESGKLISACLCKRFEWQQPGRTWQGAMVGGVYTDPQRRGKGVGSALLQWGAQTLRGAGVEFAALWTTQPGFYERLDWVAADIGMFGSCGSGEGNGGASGLDSVRTVPLAMSNDREIDDIRTQWLDAYVHRQPLDYSQQPIPAESVEVLLWSDDGESSSYALLGRSGGTGILYEMIGNESGFKDLWEAIRQRHKKIVINDSLNAPS
ncbi:MAG TPA: GNAT family N-acetyltransferase, partial [Burkholderiaceae bacterium]|nr:GNAT family N-acetyltransferase [Burkholderiaceae bacterium]